MAIMDDRGKTEGLDSVADPRTLLERLFESPVAYQIFRADGRCLLVNPAFRTLFGSPPPPDYNVFRDDVLTNQGFLDHLRRALAGETLTVPADWQTRERCAKSKLAKGFASASR
jgi:PAS domain-containing protein